MSSADRLPIRKTGCSAPRRTRAPPIPVRPLTPSSTLPPGIGAPRPRANPALRDLRMHPVRGFENHLLFYRPIPGGIELIRVLHGMRDIEAIMQAEADPEREGE
jgi:hypothetical protein